MDESVKSYLKTIGARGGKAKTPNKIRAVVANLQKARAAKKKLQKPVDTVSRLE